MPPQGLTVYLEAVFGDAGKARGVVLGYDHRAYLSLNSERFAVLSAAVLMSRGFTVHLFEGFVSTPTVVRDTAPPPVVSVALSSQCFSCVTWRSRGAWTSWAHWQV